MAAQDRDQGMIDLNEQAHAAQRIVNEAITVDHDRYTVASMAAWMGVLIIQAGKSNDDLRAYASHLRQLADTIEREGLRT